MKKSLIHSGILFFILTLATVSLNAQNEEIKAKIEKINKEMQQAMLTGNSSNTYKYYADDAVSLPNYGKMAQGLDAIRKSNEQMMAGGMKITSFETSILMISTCENNIAEIGTYKMSFTIQGSPNAMTDVGKYLTIWEQQSDGSLKIKFETWNTDAYPMAGM